MKLFQQVISAPLWWIRLQYTVPCWLCSTVLTGYCSFHHHHNRHYHCCPDINLRTCETRIKQSNILLQLTCGRPWNGDEVMSRFQAYCISVLTSARVEENKKNNNKKHAKLHVRTSLRPVQSGRAELNSSVINSVYFSAKIVYLVGRYNSSSTLNWMIGCSGNLGLCLPTNGQMSELL